MLVIKIELSPKLPIVPNMIFVATLSSTLKVVGK